MELCGVVWSYVELCGAVWSSVELCGVLRSCVELCGVVWSCVELEIDVSAYVLGDSTVPVNIVQSYFVVNSHLGISAISLYIAYCTEILLTFYSPGDTLQILLCEKLYWLAFGISSIIL